MLPNHAPLTVAEQFATLDALAPGRIDLGIGRSTGSDGIVAALLGSDPSLANNFAGALSTVDQLLDPVGRMSPPADKQTFASEQRRNRAGVPTCGYWDHHPGRPPSQANLACPTYTPTTSSNAARAIAVPDHPAGSITPENTGDAVLPAETFMRYGAVDVYYPTSGGARAGLLIAADPTFATVVDEQVTWLAQVAPYEPGAFFRRELPAMRAVLQRARDLDLVIVDGYVDLDPAGRPGLGARLHDEIRTPVIGVAKTAFRSATHAAAVYRGVATRPLYVTAAGLPIEQAAELVAAMAGPHRLPDALRRVDRLSRGADPTAGAG